MAFQRPMVLAAVAVADRQAMQPQRSLETEAMALSERVVAAVALV
jgi:hypothetical protein